jgi:two-component system, NarL family, nitrate/nitrite response regulator NarL
MLKKVSVLLVDDHYLVIEGVKNILQSLGYVELVGAVLSGRDALTIVTEITPDIIFLDISLPDINGIELCSKLLASRPKAKIIALSTFNNLGYVGQMMQQGASGYLLKNASVQEFDTAISTVLSGKKYFSEEIQMALLQERSIMQQVPELTPREKDVLLLIADGLTNPQIAAKLFVSVNTINTHRQNLFAKFEVNNIAALLKEAHKYKMLPQS